MMTMHGSLYTVYLSEGTFIKIWNQYRFWNKDTRFDHFTPPPANYCVFKGSNIKLGVLTNCKNIIKNLSAMYF